MAGRDIKGISVEISGDTTKLTTALQGVNKDTAEAIGLMANAGTVRPSATSSLDSLRYNKRAFVSLLVGLCAQNFSDLCRIYSIPHRFYLWWCCFQHGCLFGKRKPD